MLNKSVFRKILGRMALFVLFIGVTFLTFGSSVVLPTVSAEQVETRLPTVTPTIENEVLRIAGSSYQAIYPSQSYDLPDFVLPYSSDASVYWTGGPHEYGNLDTLGQYPSGMGSGLDFAGGHFEILAMASGKVEDTYCIDHVPSLGCIDILLAIQF